MTAPKPVVLCIMDGWGLRSEIENNAVALSDTPTYDAIMAECPNATLKTCGPDVGLPEGQMGNSEVGHMNIGAGRVVSMDLGQIDLAIENGEFAANPALAGFVGALQKSGGTAHVMGIVSDGGVHGHLNHMIAGVQVIAGLGVPVKIHALTDGRDVPPDSAVKFLRRLENALPDGAEIATVIGRYYAMDRDRRWPRVRAAYDAIVHGKGQRAKNAEDACLQAMKRGETDEFFQPTVLQDFVAPKGGDGFFSLNFRTDRAREILAALGDPDFDHFSIKNRPLMNFLGMANYSTSHDRFMATMFPKQIVTNTLGAWVSQHNKRQFRLAETEKYPHVTFFMNGGIEEATAGEDRFMPNSPKVATYDLQPEMSSAEVTDHFLTAIRDRYDLIIVNYANPDMVGHTGDLAAAIAACEAVDRGLTQVVDALRTVGGAMILTADHGNCETMIDPDTGKPHTAHTTNPVPVAVIGGGNRKLRSGGRLADLAPTLLDLMALPKPAEMTGKTLLV